LLGALVEMLQLLATTMVRASTRHFFFIGPTKTRLLATHSPPPKDQIWHKFFFEKKGNFSQKEVTTMCDLLAIFGPQKKKQTGHVVSLNTILLVLPKKHYKRQASTMSLCFIMASSN
jgi:hypothetical protein